MNLPFTGNVRAVRGKESDFFRLFLSRGGEVGFAYRCQKRSRCELKVEWVSYEYE